MHVKLSRVGGVQLVRPGSDKDAGLSGLPGWSRELDLEEVPTRTPFGCSSVELQNMFRLKGSFDQLRDSQLPHSGGDLSILWRK